MVGKAALIGATVLLVWSWSAPPAHADKGEIVGVLDLDTRGVPKAAAKRFEKSIEEGLSGEGLNVGDR
jgi:hypothetical protein